MRRADREVKDCKEIHQILESCKVCRLGIMDEGKVYIVPMNYGYEYEEGKLVLYFHGAREGKKLRLLGENPSVGIEMDGEHELVAGKSGLPVQLLLCKHYRRRKGRDHHGLGREIKGSGTHHEASDGRMVCGTGDEPETWADGRDHPCGGG